jgi:hypothetical protein
MSTSFFKFFNLDEAFTKEDLDRAYFKKLENPDNLNITTSYRDFYKELIEKEYKKAIRYAIELGISPIDSKVPAKEISVNKNKYFNLSSISNDIIDEPDLYSEISNKSSTKSIDKKIISKPERNNSLKETSFFKFFNLGEAFTKEDLDRAYFKKLKNADTLNISMPYRDFYKKLIKKEYKKAITYSNEIGLSPINSIIPLKEKSFNKNKNFNLSSISNNMIDEEDLYSEISKKSISKKIISKPFENNILKDIIEIKNQIYNDINWYENRKGHLHYIKQSYYRELNPDKSYTITEKSIINNNGKEEKKVKKYKKYPSGEIEYI